MTMCCKQSLLTRKIMFKKYVSKFILYLGLTPGSFSVTWWSLPNREWKAGKAEKTYKLKWKQIQWSRQINTNFNKSYIKLYSAQQNSNSHSTHKAEEKEAEQGVLQEAENLHSSTNFLFYTYKVWCLWSGTHLWASMSAVLAHSELLKTDFRFCPSKFMT